jgi:predicted permease
MFKWLDFKYALRLLFSAPKFSAMTLGVLIGGLSISLFTFSFLYSTIYKPLPIPEGETAKAIAVFEDGHYRYLRGFEYQKIKASLTSFAEFGVYDNADIWVTVQQSGKSYVGSYVQAGFFKFSRTSPIIGRVINANDGLVGAKSVALISYDIWQNEYQSSEDVLNDSITLNGEITDIIGVMPKDYRFPNTSKIWLPLTDNLLNASVVDSGYYYGYARLKSGVSLLQAEQELSHVVNQVYQHNAQLYDLPKVVKTVKLLTFQMAKTGNDGSKAFAFLMTVSLLILLLACINVGNLLLARSIERQKETAIRAALGANTYRLVSQLMWEGIIICVVGGILSVLLVGAALDYTEVAIHSWLPSGGSFWWHYGMDGATLLMAGVFTLVTILLSAFLPAWRSAHQDINATLRDGTRGAQSKKSGRTSRILVTIQVFLVAILMLIGSISGYIAHKLVNIDMGDDYRNVMSAHITIPKNKYPEPQQQIQLLQSLITQLKQHPNLVDVISHNWVGESPVMLEGREYLAEEDKPLIDTFATVGSTDTVGISLVAGRQFTHLDKENHRKVAIISQSMAKRYWPGESALEKSFSVNIAEKNEKVFIVGVVGNRMNSSSLFGKLDSADEVYLSGLQFIDPFQILLYKVLPNSQDADEIFYQAMFASDSNIELAYSVEKASENRNKMRESMNLMSNITFGTGFVALLLAMVGIYGLTANSVAQRTHEVGIRRAVGATDRDILQMFLKQGGKQLIIGLGIALVIFALISLAFHRFSEGIFPLYFYFTQAIAVVIGLTFVVMLAIYMPSRRAVIMEPSTALRYE